MEEFRLEWPPYLSCLFVTVGFSIIAADLYPISLYIIFSPGAIYHIVFSPVCQLLECRLWRWNMTFLETEIKELGRSTWNNTHNKRSLILTPQVSPRHRCRRKKPLRWKSRNTHTHIHTHTHTHTYTHTNIFMGVFEETNNYLLIKEKVKIQNYSLDILTTFFYMDRFRELSAAVCIQNSWNLTLTTQKPK